MMNIKRVLRGQIMTIKELYEQINGNSNEVLKRFGNENIVKRFVLKFLNNECFWNFKKTLSDGDEKTAFQSKHTLKGVCLNLGFGNLSKASSNITDALREKNVN